MARRVKVAMGFTPVAPGCSTCANELQTRRAVPARRGGHFVRTRITVFETSDLDATLVAQAARRGPVVLIEDDAAVRDALQCALEQWGFAVRSESTGRTAVDAVRSHGASVVITDLYMPETDGIEVIRALRRDCPGTPVIAMSGASNGDGRIGMLAVASALGAVAVLPKPFSLDELKTVLVRTLVGP